MPQPPVQITYPTAGLLPKTEIGALRFLERHPEYDGRGVLVAVFDTGVDPGAVGLQTTTTGQPKIFDMIDGTGSGDVHLLPFRTAGEEGRLEGLSGRMLQIPPGWLAKTREYRVGLKAGYDLFPPDLVTRMKEQRKKQFMLQQAQTEAQLRQQIAEWDAAHEQANDEQKRARAELQRRLEQLVAMATHYEDPGPIYDCLTFRDGDVWRAAVDTNEDGSFADEKALASYRREHQYATLRGGADLNFAVNIYKDGELLSLVADCGPHGTHVAGIIAAHFPEQPELNGIAPGAQILSVKIGDPRLQEMETESGLTRGIIAAVEQRCDLINMSYGEPSRTPQQGLIPDLLSQAVEQHGLIFVSSAGNAGPALSTVGAPGGTLSSAIGVGAYVTPSLMQAAYALREDLPEMAYTWTSRGPTFDGALGVTVCAPGGAIAPVPTWKQQRTMRMNGTSMASPNVCGGLALIVSAVKQQQLPYTPHSVRRAVQATARPLPDTQVFAQGAGVLQVPEAYKHLRQYSADPVQRLDIDVTVGNDQRGIYLREPDEVQRIHDVTVKLQPKFRESATGAERVDFELRLRLQSTADWVRTGDYLLLTHGAEQFQVLVDPTQLAPGAHYAEIQGFAAEAAGRGPLVRVPITVVVPQPATAAPREIQLQPGRMERLFVAVPDGATWADLVIERVDDGVPGRYMVQAVQKHDGLTFRDRQSEGMVTIPAGGRTSRSFAVTGGKTLELCIAQFWSSLGETRLRSTLRFQSLGVREEPILLTAGQGPQRIELENGGERKKLAPRGQFDSWRRTIAPLEARVTASADPRDQLPDGRTMHELMLRYEFETHSGPKVTLRFPRTDDWLYDSPFGGQLWLLFDSAGRHIATDDIWPSAVTLRPGKHKLLLRLRHPSAQQLEPLRTMPLQVDSPLQSPARLIVSSSPWDQDQNVSGSLAAGERRVVYLAAPEKLPHGLQAGDQLLGSVHFTQPQDLGELTGDTPAGHSVHWFSVTKEAPAPQEQAQGSNDPSAVAAGRGDDAQQAARQEAVTKLKNLDTEAQREERLAEIVAAADTVLATIDKTALAQQLGQRASDDDPDSRTAREKAEALRDLLADTLYRKGRALGYMELPEVLEKHPIADPAAHDRAFQENFSELARWADTTQRKYVLLTIRHHRRREHWGAALELLNKYLREGAPDERFYEKRQQVIEQLGWEHWAAYDRAWRVRQFPPAPMEF